MPVDYNSLMPHFTSIRIRDQIEKTAAARQYLKGPA